MAMPKTGLDIQSRSPRSLQARNTKNLSLSIQDGGVSSLAKLEDGISNVVGKPVTISSGMMKKGPADRSLQSRRSEASIYAIPVRSSSGSSSPIYTLSGQRSPDSGTISGSKIGRVHSLSLSVKTKELGSSSGARERARTLNSALETSTPKLSHFGPGRDQELSDSFNMDLSYSDATRGDAYPSGPLLVIPPNIFLYSEPKPQEIMEFDVVINVAKEIADLRHSVPETKKIFYHHIGWSHNSKISTDLDYLTGLMHEASTKGKKVLIHCQCGVSRSASLIVAYIMRYHNLGLNEAYSHVKGIAKDISPNMNLIFQLMEWMELRNKTIESPDKTECCVDALSSASPTNELTIVSPESTPRIAGEFFNKVSTTSSSSSSSSTSTSSSTIVGNQTQSKPIALPTELVDYLPAEIPAPSSTESFWSELDAV